MKKLLVILAALVMVGCSNFGSLKRGMPESVPVDCKGYIESSVYNRALEINLIKKRMLPNDVAEYKVGGKNPFYSQAWVKEYQLDYIKCDNLLRKVKKPF